MSFFFFRINYQLQECAWSCPSRWAEEPFLRDFLNNLSPFDSPFWHSALLTFLFLLENNVAHVFSQHGIANLPFSLLFQILVVLSPLKPADPSYDLFSFEKNLRLFSSSSTTVVMVGFSEMRKAFSWIFPFGLYWNPSSAASCRLALFFSEPDGTTFFFLPLGGYSGDLRYPSPPS